jgi:hypothetical protein
MKMEATKVGCQACKQKGKSKFNSMIVFGGITFFLMVYGLVSLILDLISIF